LLNITDRDGTQVFPTYEVFFRIQLFLNWLPSNININVKLLTKGSDFLTYQENTSIFRHAFKYIKDSKRFTNFISKVDILFHILNFMNSGFSLNIFLFAKYNR
jgi:hypothetical protein